MASKGDDCYFYYYSTCTKGDKCPFRHCEAAMGSETVCSLWQEKRCFRNVCKFRHMEIKKNRKEIACYWENQPVGCQKPHCAFHHEKPRLIDGLYVPPDKGSAVREEKEEEAVEVVLPSAPAPISNPTNPQLRGVLKAEIQDSVPSPTHPPVVINPVDDDDEDDQVSEEGDEASSESPRKPVTSNKDRSLNFDIKTLEEIRLRKALMANLSKAGNPGLQGTGGFTPLVQRSNGTDTGNTQSLAQPAGHNTKSEFHGKRNNFNVFGKRTVKEGELRLKENFIVSLGGFKDSSENASNAPPPKALKSVHERLGVQPDLAAPKLSKSGPNPSGEIEVKTLEKIRQEKASKPLIQPKTVRFVTEDPAKALNVNKKANKSVGLKTFSERLHEKKHQKDELDMSQEGSRSPEESLASAGSVAVATPIAEVRVKTLEEIRKEKATRLQAKPLEATDANPKRRIHRIISHSTSSVKKSQESETNVDPVTGSVTTNGKSESSSQAVTVKSFEEIMREKRLRKQQEEEQLSSASQQTTQKPTSALPKDDSSPVLRPRVTSPPATSPLGKEASNQTKPLRHHLGLKTSPMVPQSTSPELDTGLGWPTTSLNRPKQVAEVAASPGGPCQESQPEKTVFSFATTTSTHNAVEMKVRPKVNVKPSVVKPATRMSPGQKKKARSAVAAVKPLGAFSDTQPPSKRIKLDKPQCTPEIGCHIGKAASSESSVVTQSPAIKTTAQRRASLLSRSASSAGHSSTVDDFENLLDEFTDDGLEEVIELDPGKDEDDLLMELSEMIDN